MNAPATINIEKYAEALNNLVGMDIGYLGDSDENVDAIVEVIRAAKQLENRVKELTEENEHLKQQNEIYEVLNKKLEDACESYAWTYGTSVCKELFLKKEREDTIRQVQSVLKDAFEVLEYNADIKRKTVKVEELCDQVDWVLHEVVPNRIDEVIEKLLEEKE